MVSEALGAKGNASCTQKVMLKKDTQRTVPMSKHEQGNGKSLVGEPLCLLALCNACLVRCASYQAINLQKCLLVGLIMCYSIHWSTISPRVQAFRLVSIY